MNDEPSKDYSALKVWSEYIEALLYDGNIRYVASQFVGNRLIDKVMYIVDILVCIVLRILFVHCQRVSGKVNNLNS
jgi:hypothetical protein